MNFKLRNIVVFIIFFMINTNCINVFAYESIIENKTILVIGSYSFQNEWETSVLKGFEKILDNKNTIKIEYLDSNTTNSSTYHETFLDYLDVKYENENIDCIFVMDDEAFNVIKEHLFKEGRICYRKPTFFVGINNIVNLTEEEKEYLAGVINIETCMDCIHVIGSIQKNMDNIYVLCDDSIYSKRIIANVSTVYPEKQDHVQVHIIKTNRIGEMEAALSEIDESSSIILLSGTYINEMTNSIEESTQVINSIKSVTKTPIYTTLYNYVEAGAIGGVVNDGEKLGEISAMFLSSVVNGDSLKERYILTPSYNSINTAVFNYKAIREYNVNPLTLPNESVFLYKKPYNLLFPMYVIYLIWISVLIIISLIIYLIITTIYHKKKSERASLETMAAIQRENIKTDCIILMSHEFRTPLNIIINATKLLLMKCNNDDYEKDYYIIRLNSIIKNSNRLNKAINNSIDVAKLESGIMNTTFKMYNIVEVVENITETIIDFANSNNIEITFDTEEEEIYTAIDRRSIERVILNLLSNAIKSINDGGHIYVDCRRDDKNVYISIKDTGIGMTEEVKKHIFDKFFQNSDYTLRRKHEGNGLGLFIVRGLINIHNGDITVESRVNVGSTFKIKIPIKIVDDKGFDDTMKDELNHMANMEFSDIDQN